MRIPSAFLVRATVGMLIAVVWLSCQTSRTASNSSPKGEFVVLSINDVYRINGLYDGKEGGLARVRTLRRQLEAAHPDLLCLHAGDFLFPSLLSETYKGKQMISVLNLLDGGKGAYDDRFFVTFGNHEFEKSKMKDTMLLQGLINSSEFHWLGSNIKFAMDSAGKPAVSSANLVQSRVIRSGGVNVGLFSLTTDVKHPAYVEMFEDPVATAREATAALKAQGAEFIIALTHLSVSEDKQILQTLGDAGPDLIIGGHEHDQQSHQVNGRWILKANADAASAVVAKVKMTKSGPQVSFEFEELGPSVAQDPTVQADINGWFARYDHDYCAQNALPDGCTYETYSFAGTDLIAEEIRIRKYETNLGDWIVDQALNAFRDAGARIAFVNSGSIRLNQNIQKGDSITRRHINEMFPYKNNLRLIQITGAELQQIVDRAGTDWAGNGWWLQIAGFAFTYDPGSERADHLTLLGEGGPRTIHPEDTLLAVTTDYLLDKSGDQDGYTMLGPDMIQPSDAAPELTEVVINALKAAGKTGVAPQVDGRICNTTVKGPCLCVKE